MLVLASVCVVKFQPVVLHGGTQNYTVFRVPQSTPHFLVEALINKSIARDDFVEMSFIDIYTHGHTHRATQRLVHTKELGSTRTDFCRRVASGCRIKPRTSIERGSVLPSDNIERFSA